MIIAANSVGSMTNLELQDFVLLRSDGIPLYNLGVVVDDITMDITLVCGARRRPI
jgi:glutamyl-tRNA synthetase